MPRKKSSTVELVAALGLGAVVGIGAGLALRPVQAQPSGSLTASPSSIQPGQTVTFTFTSQIQFTTFLWDFGDGSADETTVPMDTHTFSAVGNYTVRVSATTGTGEGLLATAHVVVTSPPPPPPPPDLTGTFSANPKTIIVGGSVELTVVFSGGTLPYSSAWDFGDGSQTTTISSTATTIIKSHSYLAMGTYTVRATVTDSLGKMLALQTIVVVTVPPLIQTAISCDATPAHANIGDTVTVFGKLTRTDTGAGLVEPIVVQVSSDNGTTWVDVVTGTTGTDGAYSLGIIFSQNGSYRVRASFAGA